MNGGLMQQAAQPETDNEENIFKDDGYQPTQEENGQLEKYVRNGMRIIHSLETRDAVVKSLGAKDPIQGLAKTLFFVTSKLKSSMGESAAMLPDVVVAQGVQELLGQLIEISNAAYGNEFDQRDIKEVVNIMVNQERAEAQPQQASPQQALPQQELA